MFSELLPMFSELLPVFSEMRLLFGQLLPGLLNTLGIAVLSLLLSLLAGVCYAAWSQSPRRWLRGLLRLWLEAMRAIPLLVWLFLVFFALPLSTGLDLGPFWTAVLVFSVWGATEAGEVLRGALLSLPGAQREAGLSLGLNQRQLFLYVLLPQLIERSLPPLLNVATRLVKTTSVTILIGVVDLTRAGQQIIERDGQALLIYSLLFVLYFLICFPLSWYSRRLEQRWSPT